MQFDFMPERATIDTVSIIGRTLEENHAKGKKLYMCFVDLKKASDIVLRKVLERVMWKT